MDTHCVDLLPLTPSNAAHMATYAGVDIGLDPFPYAGTTTTAEALWMGVPCVTLRGRCHAQNVGASLLGAVGLEEACVAEDEEGYVAKAAALAADVQVICGIGISTSSVVDTCYGAVVCTSTHRSLRCCGMVCVGRCVPPPSVTRLASWPTWKPCTRSCGSGGWPARAPGTRGGTVLRRAYWLIAVIAVM